MKLNLFQRAVCVASALCLLAGIHAAAAEGPAANQLTDQEKKDGWKLLFDGKTTDGWVGYKGDKFPENVWKIEDGALTTAGAKGGGDIMTADEYSDFELSLEFKMTPGINSGIKYFIQKGSNVGFEYQILDDAINPDAKLGTAGNRKLASLYELLPPHDVKAKPMGEWNEARIVVKGTHIEHWLNGVKVLEFDRTGPEFAEAFPKSKFNTRKDFGKHDKGHILLQEHGTAASFRNIKIRVPKK